MFKSQIENDQSLFGCNCILMLNPGSKCDPNSKGDNISTIYLKKIGNTASAWYRGKKLTSQDIKLREVISYVEQHGKVVADGTEITVSTSCISTFQGLTSKCGYTPLFLLDFSEDASLKQITLNDKPLYENFMDYLKNSTVLTTVHTDKVIKFSLANYLHVDCNDHHGTVQFLIYNPAQEVAVGKFLLETHLVRPDCALHSLYPSPSDTDLLGQVEANKGQLTITLPFRLTATIPEHLLARLNRYSPQQEIKKFAYLLLQGRRSNSGFFTNLPPDYLGELAAQLEPNLSANSAKEKLKLELQNAEAHYENSFFFTFNKEEIFFSKPNSIGTSIVIIPTEYFQNWFKSLPLEQQFKFGAYEFYKVDKKTVEINKGLSGFQVQACQLNSEVRFTVYLNCNADTILNGDDVEQQRKNNLLHPLKVLYKILVQNYANKKLIEAVIDSDFNFSEVQRALKNGADPDAPLSLMSPTLSLKYPTLLHYICLSPGLIQKDQCRSIALELIYWGAKAAKDVASDQIKQVNAVLDIVNNTIEHAPMTYSRVRDVLALFIKILMENYVDSGSWLSPRPHKEEASLIEVGGKVCYGLVVGSVNDMMAVIKKYHASEAIDKTGTFHGLLDFILDPVKLLSAVHAHAKAHPRDYKIEILPFPTALLKKEGMSPLSEFNYITEVQDEENKSERSLFKSLLG